MMLNPRLKIHHVSFEIDHQLILGLQAGDRKGLTRNRYTAKETIAIYGPWVETARSLGILHACQKREIIGPLPNR